MSEATAKCDDCGRFMDPSASGASWAYKYDMVAMECSHEHWRCSKCTDKYGPVHSNARPADGNMSPYERVIK